MSLGAKICYHQSRKVSKAWYFWPLFLHHKFWPLVGGSPLKISQWIHVFGTVHMSMFSVPLNSYDLPMFQKRIKVGDASLIPLNLFRKWAYWNRVKCTDALRSSGPLSIAISRRCCNRLDGKTTSTNTSEQHVDVIWLEDRELDLELGELWQESSHWVKSSRGICVASRKIKFSPGRISLRASAIGVATHYTEWEEYENLRHIKNGSVVPIEKLHSRGINRRQSPCSRRAKDIPKVGTLHNYCNKYLIRVSSSKFYHEDVRRTIIPTRRYNSIPA